MRRTFTLASDPSIVKRGLQYSIVVGTVLVLINHGDRLLKGTVSSYQWWQIVLTYAVPYIVSSLSSVQAILKNEAIQNTEQN